MKKITALLLVFLMLLARPIGKILGRIKTKYGIRDA